MKRRRVSTPSLPYENATSGKRATEDIKIILQSMGASEVGVMDKFDRAEVMVQFTWRECTVRLCPPAKGYAAAWLRRHPSNHRMRTTKVEYERRALQIGQIAICSVLRDWIKGQVMAIECGVLSFEGAFLGQIMLPTGETVLERIERLSTGARRRLCRPGRRRRRSWQKSFPPA